MNPDRHVCFAIIFFVSLFILGGCSREEKTVVSYDPGKPPIKIGICLAAQGESREYAGHQLDGIRMAHELRPVLGGALITLVEKQPSGTTRESGIMNLMGKEGFSGIIYSTSACEDKKLEPGSECEDISLTVMTGPGCFPGNDDIRFLRIGSTLYEQARVAAEYCLHSLNAKGAAIVLDHRSSSCVRLASLFSSELIRLGGSIVNIAYVGEDRGDLDAAIKSLLQHHPDIVYVPYYEDTSVDVIGLLRGKGFRSDIIVTNVLLEQRFLKQGGKTLDGVYLVTDFHPSAVKSSQGKAFQKLYEKNRKNVGPLESSTALSADAYFILVDLLEGAALAKGFEETLQGVAWDETISGIIGGNPSERLIKEMQVCQISCGIIRGTRLIHKESINPWASNSHADVGAE